MKELIGTGTFASVYLECAGHGRVLAVKQSKIECPAWPSLPEHPNLLCLLKKETRKSTFVYYSKYYKQGDLFELTQRCNRLPEDVAVYMLACIASGLQAMHRAGFAHRDLKLENILLSDEYAPVICDFDFTIQVPTDKQLSVFKRCGSIPYCAPEVLAGRPHDPRQADCWSLGIVLFATVTGRLPFDSMAMSNDDASIVGRIKNSEYTVPGFVSQPVADIIASLLDPNPELRPSVDQLRHRLQGLLRLFHRQSGASVDTTIKHRIDRMLEPVGYAITPPPFPSTLYLHSNLSGGGIAMFSSSDSATMEGYTLLPSTCSGRRQ